MPKKIPGICVHMAVMGPAMAAKTLALLPQNHRIGLEALPHDPYHLASHHSVAVDRLAHLLVDLGAQCETGRTRGKRPVELLPSRPACYRRTAAWPAPDAADLLKGWSSEAEQIRDTFHTAINDDLDLPTALSITREAARNSKIQPAERRRLILDFDRVLGLRLNTVEAKKPRAISDEALALVRERDEARAARDWQRSDELRDQLTALGFEVRDTPKGTELV